MEKTRNELREDILMRLRESLGINTAEDGSIAIAIVDAVLDEIYGLYLELDHAKKQAYLSTSQGYYTELISELVGVEKEEYETSESLKRRASQSVQTHAKGNRLAIESAMMAVPGVASIDYRTYGMGTGSFIAYVYPEEGHSQLRLLDAVEDAVADVVSDGIYYEIRQPKEARIDYSVVLQFDTKASQIEKGVIRDKVRAEIRNYINSLRRNDVFYINESIEQVMRTSDRILDVEIIGLFVDGIQRQIANTFPENDERFVSGTIEVS